jgi:hypothetical protein
MSSSDDAGEQCGKKLHFSFGGHTQIKFACVETIILLIRTSFSPIQNRNSIIFFSNLSLNNQHNVLVKLNKKLSFSHNNSATYSCEIYKSVRSYNDESIIHIN